MLTRRGLWANDDFLKLWVGETISVFGSMVGHVAISFTAVLVLDASALEVGLLTAAGIVPGLLFGFLAGVWVDRWRKRPIMIAADVGRAAVLFSVPIAYAFGALTMGQLFAVAIGIGSLNIFAEVAYFAYVPALLKKEELLEGNSKVAATNSLSEVAGFGIAGWLVQGLTAPIAVAVDAVSFLVSSVFTLAIRKPEDERPQPAETPRLRDEVTEGMRTIWKNGVLRALAASDTVAWFSINMYGAVYLLYMTDELGFQPGLLGLFFAVGGLTSLIGSVYAGRAARTFGAGRTIAFGRIVMSGFMALVLVANDASALAAALLIGQQLGDAFWTIVDINDETIRQVVSPEGVLGRVKAASRQAVLAAMLLGALAGGLLGELTSLRVALGAGVGGMVLSGVIAMVPALWNMRDLPLQERTPGGEVIAAPAEP